MALYFLTGNSGKFKEVKKILPEVEQLELDLLEIQELDSKKVIEEKLNEAVKQHDGEFFVGDNSIHLECLNGFPGPLIKWLMKAIGNKGIYEMVSKYDDNRVTAKCIYGYTNRKEVKFFEGEIKGRIVAPKGDNGFGWDPIFQPEGHDKTFGEMNLDEKNMLSMRMKAVIKMKEYFESK